MEVPSDHMHNIHLYPTYTYLDVLYAIKFPGIIYYSFTVFFLLPSHRAFHTSDGVVVVFCSILV